MKDICDSNGASEGYTMRSAFGKASQRKQTLSHSRKDKPNWSPFWSKIQIFIILHHKTLGFGVFDSVCKKQLLFGRPTIEFCQEAKHNGAMPPSLLLDYKGATGRMVMTNLSSIASRIRTHLELVQHQ